MAVPNRTIETTAAAEAVLFLFHKFHGPVEDTGDWVEALQERWPDLAAALFTAARDE